MPPLPIVSGQVATKVFGKLGWVVVRRPGSHIILTKQGTMVTLSVPDQRELDRGTLGSLIRAAGLTVGQFIEALE